MNFKFAIFSTGGTLTCGGRIELLASTVPCIPRHSTFKHIIITMYSGQPQTQALHSHYGRRNNGHVNEKMVYS